MQLTRRAGSHRKTIGLAHHLTNAHGVARFDNIHKLRPVWFRDICPFVASHRGAGVLPDVVGPSRRSGGSRQNQHVAYHRHWLIEPVSESRLAVSGIFTVLKQVQD